ncbi:MAG: hypothetical protein AB8B48_12145 [Pseudomonadales bacterium]
MSITKIMFRAFHKASQVVLVVLVASHCANLAAAPKCQAAPGSQYEQAFCTLSSSRYNYGLPSLQEFRRNPAKVQYLLLKRAASREGIALSKPVKESPVTDSRSAKVTATVTAPASKPPLQSRKTDWTAYDQPNCRYTKRKITCGKRQFRLQTNRRNSELPATALGDANVLRLPEKKVNEPIDAWLAVAYKEYIVALLSIGLAGSSSTYSAFAHTYYELENTGTDFAARIQRSFALLKKDKRTLAVGKRYPDSAPLAADCEWLASTMLACNSAGKNWVYASD